MWPRPRRKPPATHCVLMMMIAELAVLTAVPTVGQLVLARAPTFEYDGSKWMARVNAIEGTPLSIQCPDTQVGADLSWRHNDTPVVDSIGQSLLHRPALVRADAGEWRCVAHNAAGTVLGRPTIVTVLWLDDFIGDDDTGEEGDRYHVSSTVGSPVVLNRPPLLGSTPEEKLRPVYLWYCNDALVQANSTHYLTARGDLIILQTSLSSSRHSSNGDEERCEVTAAVDAIGEIRSRSYYIGHTLKSDTPERAPFRILYGPIDQEIIIHDEDDQSMDDYPLQWDCVPSMADGRVRWFLDGRPLTEADEGVTIEKSGRRLVMAAAASRNILTESPSSSSRRSLSKGRQSIVHSLECKADAGAGRLLDSKSAKIRVIRAPHLIPLPTPIYRMPGGHLELSCTDARGATPQKNFRWTYNGDVIARSSRLSIEVKTSSYGVYQCEARNAAGVHSISVWLQEGTPQNLPLLNDGSTGEQDDTVVAEQTEKFTPGFNSLPEESRLSLDKIQQERLPTKESPKEHSPQLGPTIIRRPHDITVPSGEPSFTLECAAQPVDTIMWRFNDTILSPSAKYAFEGSDGGMLVVNDVRKSDAGVYGCEARNGVGAAHAAAHVTVAGGSLLEYGPTNQSILIGTNIEIPCQVAEQYRSTAEITWFVNGERVPASGNQAMRISVAPKGALLIRQAGPDNIGEYRCKIKLGSKEEEAFAFLKIIERPGMPRNVKADVLLNGNKLPKVSISWREGFNGNSPVLKHVIEMQTLATASAHPHWSDWERVADNVPAETCCTYTLESVRPSSTAQFRVAAVNKHGIGRFSLPSANITLPQMPPAAAPTKVHATARSARTVMVQWQRPASEEWNGDINGYLVRHRLYGYNVPWITADIKDGQRMNYAVEGLLVWKEYEFQVAAYNDRGEGVFSPSVRATTLEGVPAQSPKSIDVHVINSTAIRVLFEQPDEQFINGVNLGYKVQLRLMRPSEDGQSFTIDETAPIFSEQRVEPDNYDLEVEIGDLAPWTHAQLTVLCYTSAGDGPSSHPITVITNEATPSAVDDLRVDNVLFSEATVMWSRPEQANGKITRYEVRYYSESDPHDIKTHVTEGTVLSYTLIGLTASTKYVVDVRASTSKGDGPREEVRFESGVPPELPGRPSSLSVSAISSRSVNLSFNPGFDGHSPIRLWHVEAKQGDGRAGIFAAVFNTSAPKAKQLTVTGLRPHTIYQLRLIAENVKGRGAPSEPTKIFKTSPAPPEVPSTKLWAEPLSATSISISWTPLQTHQWNGDPIGYLVVYKRARRNGTMTALIDDVEGEEVDDERQHEVRTRSLRATELTLKDLKPWTEYEIDLYAENVIGRSKSAGVVRATTYESVPGAAPADVRVESRGERGALVQWNQLPPGGRNGEIVGYTVRLVPSDGLPLYRRDELTRISEVSSADQTTESFSNLRAATSYKVTVAARTLIGEGPQSSEALVRTKDDMPGKPSRITFTLVSHTEVIIKFFPPEDPNGIITQYLVTYHRSDEVDPESSKVTAPVPPTMFTFSAVGLTPKKKYIFGVSAQNAEGQGEPAVVEVWTVPPSETLPLPNPSMPLFDIRRPRSSNEIALTWSEERMSAPSKNDNGDGGFEQSVRAVEVEYQRANHDNWTRYPVDVDGTQRFMTVTGLSPNTAYSFRIRFTGDYAATSSWSAESEWMKTLSAAPSSAPLSVTVSPEDADSLSVSFVPPKRSEWNADALGFSIFYREYPPDHGQWSKAEIAPVETLPDRVRHTIRGLRAFRHYVIQVRSKNNDGTSVPSTPAFVYVGFAIPKANVSGLLIEPLSSTSLSVRWNALPREQISGYKVRYAPIVSVLRPESEMDGLLVVEENEVVIPDLLKYTEYQVSVSPYNRAGEGGSAVARTSTLEDVPGPVSALRFTDILLNSVNVSWSIPAERNGEIIGYVVAWRMGSLRGDTRQESQQTTQQQWLMADRLLEGETYHFSVRAETRKGKGPQSDGEVTVGPVEGGPPSPSRPNLLPSQASVRLEWKDAHDGSRLIGHVVQAKRVGRAFNHSTAATSLDLDDGTHRRRRSHNGKRPVHPMEEWITVAVIDGDVPYAEVHYGDLHPLSYYVFRVFGRNEKGVGLPSGESAQLFVPQNLPSELFYTSPWFVAVAGLSLLVLLVVIIGCLCVTGSTSRSSTKKSPSSHSLHYDGNFPMQMQKDNRSHLRRNEAIARPGTNTSWLSERDMYGGPPAYGMVGGGRGGSTGGDSGHGGSSPEAAVGGPINMYGLATDIIPPHQNTVDGGSGMMPHSTSHHGGSVMGSDYGSRLPLGVGTSIGHPNSIYGTATLGATNGPLRDYDADSFDDDFDDEDDGEETMRRRDDVRDDIASHYAQADKYRDTWRRVRDTEAVSMRDVGAPAAHHLQLPPAFAAPSAPYGVPSAAGSVVSHRTSSHQNGDSMESASETSWPAGHSQAAPALSKGFSSFV